MDFPDDLSTPALVLLAIVLLLMFALAVVFFIRFVRTFKLVRDQMMPFGGKAAFWLTLVYLVSPIDILPDPILFDDIALLAGAVTYINRLARGHGLLGDGDDDDDGGDAKPGADGLDDLDVDTVD